MNTETENNKITIDDLFNQDEEIDEQEEEELDDEDTIYLDPCEDGSPDWGTCKKILDECKEKGITPPNIVMNEESALEKQWEEERKRREEWENIKEVIPDDPDYDRDEEYIIYSNKNKTHKNPNSYIYVKRKYHDQIREWVKITGDTFFDNNYKKSIRHLPLEEQEKLLTENNCENFIYKVVIPRMNYDLAFYMSCSMETGENCFSPDYIKIYNIFGKIKKYKFMPFKTSELIPDCTKGFCSNLLAEIFYSSSLEDDGWSPYDVSTAPYSIETREKLLNVFIELNNKLNDTRHIPDATTVQYWKELLKPFGADVLIDSNKKIKESFHNLYNYFQEKTNGLFKPWNITFLIKQQQEAAKGLQYTLDNMKDII